MVRIFHLTIMPDFIGMGELCKRIQCTEIIIALSMADHSPVSEPFAFGKTDKLSVFLKDAFGNEAIGKPRGAGIKTTIFDAQQKQWIVLSCHKRSNDEQSIRIFASGFTASLTPDEVCVGHGKICLAQGALRILILAAAFSKGFGFKQIAAYIHQIKQTCVSSEQRVGHGTTPPFLKNWL